jgi:microsomal dipeptidase-like Zn-dependent dipeptidase
LNKKGQPLRGVVDLHTHPMAHLGFGGKLLHGAPGLDVLMPPGSIHPCNAKAKRATKVSQALGSCFATHGGHDLIKNKCGNHIRRMVLDKMEDKGNKPHDVPHPAGYPHFNRWPKHDDILHQMMWVDWVQRAHDGGLRVMVALAVNSKTLAKGIDGTQPYDDRSSGDLQIHEIKRWVDKSPFMEVAYSSKDLRRIVEQDKLAVIIGVELDDMGAFVDKPGIPSEQKVRNEIRRLHALGVRYAFPVHIIDNYFGGTAIYKSDFARANKYQAGKWWKLACAKPSDLIDPSLESGADVFVTLSLGAAGGKQPIPNCKYGHINSKGLSELGRVALDEMMRNGMIIDIDHMSARTIEGTIAYTEKSKYPLVSGHSGLRKKNGNEAQRTAREYQVIEQRGGIAGVGWAKATAAQWIGDVDDVAKAGPSIALGTDVNGMVEMPVAEYQCRDKACVRYSKDFPKAKFANKTWDYNRDGVAHYGLMPDFLKDVESRKGGGATIDRLFSGAEQVATLWKKSESIGQKLGPGPKGGSAKRALGKSCEIHGDCTSGRCDGSRHTCIPNDGTGKVGNYCTHNNHCSNKNCVSLQCKAPVGIGQSCLTNAGCASGRRCDNSTHKCIPDDNTASVGTYCTHNNHCKNKNCIANKCKAPVGIGQSCVTNASCASGRRCDNNTHKCIPDDNTANVGTYCTHNNHCKNKNCVAYKCKAQAGIGQSCQSNAGCASGRRCDNNTHKCIPNDNTGNTGNYCTHNNHCKNRNCVSNKCKAAASMGEYCQTNAGCKSGRCDNAPGNAHKCIPNDGHGKTGEYCTHNNQCKPGYYCNFKSGKYYGKCKY